ncbi:MAG: hypothetical protein FWB78_12615 [Treponema sp.]|nr:hypothetical protein [Treponema sp.]
MKNTIPAIALIVAALFIGCDNPVNGIQMVTVPTTKSQLTTKIPSHTSTLPAAELRLAHPAR